jgi:hypothetical protein
MDTLYFASHPRELYAPLLPPVLASIKLGEGFLGEIQPEKCAFSLLQSHQKCFPSASLQVESPVAMGACQTRYFPKVVS